MCSRLTHQLHGYHGIVGIGADLGQEDVKTVLIASHGGAIRALCCAWQGYAIEEIDNVPDLGNASVTVVRYDPKTDKAEFELFGYTDHLGELAT